MYCPVSSKCEHSGCMWTGCKALLPEQGQKGSSTQNRKLLKWIELWIQDFSVGLWQKASVYQQEAVLAKRSYFHFSVTAGRWSCHNVHLWYQTLKQGTTQRRASPKFLRAEKDLRVRVLRSSGFHGILEERKKD